MTHLNEVVPHTLLLEMLEQGYVKVQTHPEYPYRIYNYTDKAVFDRVWNQATLNCRGLIVDGEGRIVARGMPKFFNYNQDGAPQFELDDEVFVADKADGSLGILYRTPDGEYAIATRGSFTSDQAVWATEWLRAAPDDGFLADKDASFQGVTAVYEVIFPANRIVVDYGDREELVFLGYVNNGTGRFMPAVPGRRQMTYGEALALPPRDNAEGLVLTRVSDLAMLKVKYDEYLRLHRIIFGLNARKLWQLVIDIADVFQYIKTLPDEFQPWATEQVYAMEDAVATEVGRLHTQYENLLNHLDDLYGEGDGDNDRAQFAMEAKDRDDSWAMFMLYDGRDIEPTVWKRMKPGPGITPVAPRTEEVA